MKACSKCGVEKPLDQFYPRYAQCKACDAAVQKAYRAANKAKIDAQRAKWLAENRDRANESRREWKRRNRDKVSQSDAEYRSRNKEAIAERQRRRYAENTEKVAAINRRWKQNNPDKVAAQDARRRAARLRATPPWLSAEQIEQMTAVYAHARRLQELVGGEVHVDHIVPLRGRKVCGLHVPWNLRPLDAVDNLRKNNRLVESS